MTFNFPKLELSPPQKLWLEESYERFKSGEILYQREMTLVMHGRVPKGFDPKTIDHRLLRGGYALTLLGVWHVDPESYLFENTDKVIRAIRDLLLSDHKKEEFKASEIAAVTKLSADEIGLVFDLLGDLGSNWHAHRSGDGENYFIRVSELKSVKEYLNYDNLEETVNRAFRESDLQNARYVTPSFDISSYTFETEQRKSHPVFRSEVAQVDLSLCFVLMPFREEWSDRVYRKLIRKAVEDLGLQCLRADDLYGQIIIEDVWIKINQCAFAIVDVTARNPNVMYELGIVHAIAKPAVLITQDASQIPFDLTHHRHLIYQDNVDGFTKLAEELPLAIRGIYKENYPESLGRLSQIVDDAG